MNLGARLAGWLKAKGKTPRQLAVSLGVTPAAVYFWITGQTTPTQDNLAKAVEWLGITMEAFYGSIPKPKKLTKATKRAVA